VSPERSSVAFVTHLKTLAFLFPSVFAQIGQPLWAPSALMGLFLHQLEVLMLCVHFFLLFPFAWPPSVFDISRVSSWSYMSCLPESILCLAPRQDSFFFPKLPCLAVPPVCGGSSSPRRRFADAISVFSAYGSHLALSPISSLSF